MSGLALGSSMVEVDHRRGGIGKGNLRLSADTGVYDMWWIAGGMRGHHLEQVGLSFEIPPSISQGSISVT